MTKFTKSENIILNSIEELSVKFFTTSVHRIQQYIDVVELNKLGTTLVSTLVSLKDKGAIIASDDYGNILEEGENIQIFHDDYQEDYEMMEIKLS